jgi:flagellar motor component MotA
MVLAMAIAGALLTIGVVGTVIGLISLIYPSASYPRPDKRR